MGHIKNENSKFFKHLNSKVLELINIKDGDDIKKPVRFYFFAKNENDVSNISIELHKLGLDIDTMEDKKSEDRFYIIAEIENTKIQKQNIDDLTEVMLNLANEFNCKYDGWETEM